MPTIAPAEVYTQDPIIQITSVSGELRVDWNQYLESIQNGGNNAEQNLAGTIARESHKLFGDAHVTNSRGKRVDYRPYYRAARALEEGGGVCTAHAEVTAAVQQFLSIEPSILYKSTEHPVGHASTLWVTNAAALTIDGHYSRAINFGDFATKHDGNDVTNAAARTREALAATSGRLVISLDDDTGEIAEWMPVAPQIHDTEIPFKNYRVVLPVDEGMMFLTAVADRERYRTQHPERWESLQEQMEVFLPQHVAA